MRILSILLITLILTYGVSAQAADSDCDPADMKNYVKGGDECLAIATFPVKGAVDSKTLVVVLHGDLSGGGSADYIFQIAERAAELGATGIAMMRIGYSGGGRTSTGLASRSERRNQVYTADEMDAIADATQRLKLHYGADQVVMIGHSGGAVMTGVILGRHPGLVQRALLLSCPCDIPTWRQMRNRKPLLGAENPRDYLDSIPAETMIRLVVGSKDSNTFPALSHSYAQAALAGGLDVSVVEVSGAGHNLDAVMADSAGLQEAIKAVILGQ